MIQYTKYGNDLYYEPEFNVFFKSSPLAVREAEIRFLRGIVSGTCLPTFQYYYEFLGLQPPEGASELGWNYEYLAEEWDTMWVDIVYIPRITEDGIPYIELNYPMAPKPMDYVQGWYEQ